MQTGLSDLLHCVRTTYGEMVRLQTLCRGSAAIYKEKLRLRGLAWKKLLNKHPSARYHAMTVAVKSFEFQRSIQDLEDRANLPKGIITNGLLRFDLMNLNRM